MRKNLTSCRLHFAWPLFILLLLFYIPNVTFSQVTNTVSGTVKASTRNEPIEGVNVLIKGSNTGTTTGSNGSYRISVPGVNDTLVFSSVGFVSQEIAVSGRSSLDIDLVEETKKSMDQVVVVGYGTQKKTSVTGSIAAISGKELLEAPSTNITNSLAGRLPGLIAIQTSGKPGAGSFLSIRGSSTLGGDFANSALIVVDGIVRDNALDQLDPNQVASISILKDASATAVYGSRASNGVILITTKRGQTGKPTFNYNGFVGNQQPTVYPSLMNAFEYATTFNEALKNEGQPLRFNQEELEAYRTGEAGTNYYPLTIRNKSMQTQQNINISGGSDAVKYFFSGGLTRQEGMFEAINYRAYSLRSNVDARINKNLTISGDFDVSSRAFNNSGYTAEQIFGEVIASSPDKNLYNPDGSLNYQASFPSEYAKSGYGKDRVNVLQTTLTLKQDLPFLNGLSLSGRGSFGKEYTNSKNYRVPIVTYRGSFAGDKVYCCAGPDNKPRLERGFSEYNSLQYNVSLNFNRTFYKHEVSALALWEQFQATGNDFNGVRNFFPANGLDELDFGGQQQQEVGGSSFEDARRSYVMRANYAYNQKYFVEASFRVDGSVAFPTTKKYGFFPALSAGWRISEESFMKNSTALSFINNLKIRASYGKVGNDRNVYSGRVPTFQYLQAYNLSGTWIGGNNPLSTILPGVFPNPFITWETAAITNIGLDGSLWGGKLQFTLDAFKKRTSDILITRSRSTPETFGAELPAENFAVVDNKGLEASITHNNNIGDFRFYVRLNAAFANNNVINIDEPAGRADYQVQTGRPLDFITGYKSLGFFQTDEEIDKSPVQFNGFQKPGDIKYADVGGPAGTPDGIVNQYDRTILSYDNDIPKLTGGLTLGGNYKNFDFAVLFQGAARVKIMLYHSAREFFVNSGENNFKELLDYWTPENPDAKYPRPLFGAEENTYDSNMYLRDARYLRLRSLDLGYTFSNRILNGVGIQKLRVYVAGSNLFVIDKDLMFDPEAQATAGNYYPQQRTLNLGLNLTL